MEQVRIDTAQNVKINYTLATISDRIFAYLMDVGVMLVWVLLVSVVAGFFEGEWSTEGEIVLMVIILLPIGLYHLLMEVFFNGQSLGKRIMKIKVVRLDGSQPGLGDYLLRWLMRIVEFTLFFMLAGVVYLISGRGQRLGDILAGTTVVRSKRKYTLEDTILYSLDTTYQPRYPQVRNLSSRDIEIIKEGLRYSMKHRNYNTIYLLNEQVMKVMGIESHEMPYAQFLDLVVRDFNYYQVADAQA